MSRCKAVCTGAAGFVGSHLVDRLFKDGWQVLAYDNLVNGLAENLGMFGLNEYDIVDDFSDNLWEQLLEDVDVVFHLAALGSVPFSVKHPDEVFKTNVRGTQMILEAAAKTGTQVVFASSASYYGDRPENPDIGLVAKTEEMEPRPKNHYAASKVFGEMWGMAFYNMHNLPFTAMRFFNVFGPRQRSDTIYSAVVPKFIKAALEGGTIELHGGGMQTRDMTYVDDVVDALIAVADPNVREKVAGQAFNVCAGGCVKVLDLACEIGRLCTNGMIRDSSPPKFDEFEIVIVPPRPGDILNSIGCGLKLYEATGWGPKVSWQEGIKRTVAWHKERMK